MIEQCTTHSFLDRKVIEEAGPYHHLLSRVFDQVLLGDSKAVNTAHIALHMLKEHRSENCYKIYEHLWNNILVVYNGEKELAEMQQKAAEKTNGLENKTS